MSAVVIGVADYKVSHDPAATLVTYALGSCIGLVLFDPVAKVGGLLHYMLPSSSIDAAKAHVNPAMYADTGIPLLLREMQRLGANVKRLVAHMAGGSQIMDPQGLFAIGKRNHIAAKNLLWKAGILVKSEAVGGNASRSFGLDIGTGQIWLKQQEASASVGQPASGIRKDYLLGDAHGLPSTRS